jgi:hypothetical protein
MTSWLRTGIGMASTVVSLLVGVLTLIFLVRPALQPEGEQVATSAVLGNPHLESNVALGDYYQRLQWTPPESFSDTELQSTGAVIGFSVAIEGFKGSTLPLRWSVLDAETMERLSEKHLVDQPGWPDGTFTPESQHDQASGEVWVQIPERSGRYIVRLALLDPGGVTLSTLDSEPIAVSGQ